MQLISPHYNQQMRVKLKQSNSTFKHFLLPQLKKSNLNRYTPRNRPINQSLPKITEAYVSTNANNISMRPKFQSSDKPGLREKIKSGYQKKKQLIYATPYLYQNMSSNEIDQGNMTKNFKNEIQKNLVLIKKEKENHRKAQFTGKQRYNTPRHATLQNNSLKRILQKSQKCITEEDDVFSKLNQIIIKSQSKPAHLIQEPRHISFSSYLSKEKRKEKDDPSYPRPFRSDQHIKTDPNYHENSLNFANNKTEPNEQSIKHVGNYHQWRKLSIDSTQEKKINYEVSSYENQTDRIERIRSKNQLSLKKYIQGKSYLTKLIKYRDSSSLLSQNT